MHASIGPLQICPPTFEIAMLDVVLTEVRESLQHLMEDVAYIRFDQLLPCLRIVLNQLIKIATLLVQSPKDLSQVGCRCEGEYLHTVGRQLD